MPSKELINRKAIEKTPTISESLIISILTILVVILGIVWAFLVLQLGGRIEVIKTNIEVLEKKEASIQRSIERLDMMIKDYQDVLFVIKNQ